MTPLTVAAKRLEFAWMRLYCVSVPKPYRRLWIRETTHWGPVGLMIFVTFGAMVRVLDQAVKR